MLDIFFCALDIVITIALLFAANWFMWECFGRKLNIKIEKRKPEKTVRKW